MSLLPLGRPHKFARVSLYNIFFFGFCFLYFVTPHLSRAQGGFLNTPHPLFGRCPDSTQLWGSLPASLFRRVFPSFLSPPIRISLTGLHMLQATLQLSFSVSGRESPTVGPGHSPQLNPSHLGGITPTLPISLREFFWVF